MTHYYLITYTLNKPRPSYSALYALLDTYTHHEVGTSSYVIATEKLMVNVYGEFAKLTDANDTFCVFRITGYHAKGTTEAGKWLNAHVTWPQTK